MYNVPAELNSEREQSRCRRCPKYGHCRRAGAWSRFLIPMIHGGRQACATAGFAW